MPTSADSKPPASISFSSPLDLPCPLLKKKSLLEVQFPIGLTRSVILGSLFEASDDSDRWPEDLEVFLKLHCFDNAGMWKHRNEGLKEISSKPPWPRSVELCHPHARPEKIDLFRPNIEETFISFDKRQRKAAKAEGLKV